MKYTHIIWDFDGTLFDSYPAMAQSMIETLKDYGIFEDYDKIFNLMKVSMSNMRRYLEEQYDLPEAFVFDYVKKRQVMENGNLKPFPVIEDLCRKIYESGGINHMYTHRDITAVKALDEYDLLKYFQGIVTSENNFEKKPSPEGIQYILDKYGIKSDEAIMIGDREMDLLSAKNAGIKSCFFHEGGLISENGDYNIRHFDELRRILFD